MVAFVGTASEERPPKERKKRRSHRILSFSLYAFPARSYREREGRISLVILQRLMATTLRKEEKGCNEKSMYRFSPSSLSLSLLSLSNKSSVRDTYPNAGIYQAIVSLHSSKTKRGRMITSHCGDEEPLRRYF
jgi:hypothetical protein